MKVHCAWDSLNCPGPLDGKNVQCPVVNPTVMKAIAETVYNRNYFCRHFPEAQATVDPVTVRGGQTMLGVFC
ncbi:MAG: hypothetical protein ACQCN4_11510 [Candidatus Bathyarchaeia archaeon]